MLNIHQCKFSPKAVIYINICIYKNVQLTYEAVKYDLLTLSFVKDILSGFCGM